MRIDSISQSPDRTGRFLVKFSDGSTMKLYRQTVEDFRFYPGLELDERQLAAVRESAGAYSAKMRAVRIVSASSVSKRDLENRLVRKGEDPAQAKEAVEWMAELKLVDDRTTAKQIVEGCIYRGYGIARAKQALYEKQIPKSLWEEALEDYPDQSERIAEFLRTKLRDPDDPRQVKRAIDAALRRGHSYGEVKRALELIGTESQFEEEY
ncbi:MAG: regulatory protein RecX [Ruminococcaceae bacterium]|nr:regulatory protein RecX [Oscillospiraceae bacterium]